MSRYTQELRTPADEGDTRWKFNGDNRNFLPGRSQTRGTSLRDDRKDRSRAIHFLTKDVSLQGRKNKLAAGGPGFVRPGWSWKLVSNPH